MVERTEIILQLFIFLSVIYKKTKALVCNSSTLLKFVRGTVCPIFNVRLSGVMLIYITLLFILIKYFLQAGLYRMYLNIRTLT